MADEVKVTQDPKMDITSLLKATKEGTQENAGATVASSGIPTPSVEEPSMTAQKLSPLERAKMEKEAGLGVMVNNSDLKGPAEGPTKLSVSQDAGMKASESYLDDQDKMIEASKHVEMVRPPKDQIEMISIMEGIDAVAHGGELSEEQKRLLRVVNGTKSYTSELPDLDEEGKPIQRQEEEKKLTPEEEAAKKEVVNILIDKTGFGHDQLFTEEELQKISISEEIKLVEVEEAELKTATVKMSPVSFVDKAKEYQLAGAKTPVTFPASRFRAQMAGLSFGEMGDIVVNPESMTTDQHHKRLSVIYNKMKNSNVEFTDFDDFLKHFAYTDIPIAVFGIAVSTLPEAEQVPLQCNNPTCKKSFYHSFSPRSLLRFDKMSPDFLSEFKKVVETPDSEMKEFNESSLVNTRKRIKLPDSGFIVEIGIANAYEWLYDIVDNTLGDKFRDEHPDDINGLLTTNITLLSVVRKVLVPNIVDGQVVGYDEYNKAEDIVNALYYIKPHETKILTSILMKFTTTFSVGFELRDVECPHCHHRTEVVDVDLNDLLFFKFQRQLSSSVNIDNITLW